MDQPSNSSTPLNQVRPVIEDLQPSILKELKSINGKLGFFVVIVILGIIIQLFN